MLQFESIDAAIAAFAGALIALGIYHLAVVRPAFSRMTGLLELHDWLIAGGAGGAADRFAALEASGSAVRGSIDNAGRRLDALESIAATDVSRYGFVRYDAFSDSESGSGFSYALALLNRQGDGVVLTSIYSRADTRTFGKPVAGFKPTVNASAEEMEAIERARAQGS